VANEFMVPDSWGNSDLEVILDSLRLLDSGAHVTNEPKAAITHQASICHSALLAMAAFVLLRVNGDSSEKSSQLSALQI
jgi:ADP-ribosylglycohydrolase